MIWFFPPKWDWEPPPGATRIQVVRHPAFPPGSCRGGICWGAFPFVWWRRAKLEKVLLWLLWFRQTAPVRFGFDPDEVHDALLVIDEYRQLSHEPWRAELAEAKLIGDRVYVLGQAGSALVKIGRSGNVPVRLKQVQADMAMPGLRVLWTAPGAHAEERRLHEAFASRRLSGEWFDFSGLDVPVELTAAISP